MHPLKKDIKTHALSKSREEVCGFIVENKGKLEVVRCQNASSTPEKRFEIHPETYLQVKLQNELVAIYHSHPEKAPFSRDDILAAESYALPCILYINPSKEFDAYYPKYAETKHIKDIKEVMND